MRFSRHSISLRTRQLVPWFSHLCNGQVGLWSGKQWAKTDLAALSTYRINKIAAAHNNTPRKSSYWLMQGMPRRDSETVSNAIINALQPFPAGFTFQAPVKHQRKTITHNNGGEFARRKRVEEQLELPACFCKPHSPWQRGAVENGNGRLRVDLHRKTNLKKYIDQDTHDLAMIYNNTPRKCLGYKTPTEAILNEVKNPLILIVQKFRANS